MFPNDFVCAEYTVADYDTQVPAPLFKKSVFVSWKRGGESIELTVRSSGDLKIRYGLKNNNIKLKEEKINDV